MEDILARMAGEQAAKNKAAGIIMEERKHRRINRARTIVNRFFRTGTELRGLLEVSDYEFDRTLKH